MSFIPEQVLCFLSLAVPRMLENIKSFFFFETQMFSFDGCCSFCFWFGQQWSLSRHCECQNTAVSCEMSLMTLPSDLHPLTAGKLRVLQVPSSPRRNCTEVDRKMFGQGCPTVCAPTLASLASGKAALPVPRAC